MNKPTSYWNLQKIEKIVEIFSKNFENSEKILAISENCGKFLDISRNFSWKFRIATKFFRKFCKLAKNFYFSLKNGVKITNFIRKLWKRRKNGGGDGGGAEEVQWGCGAGAVGVPKSILKFDENYLKRINRWLKIREIWFFWPYRRYKNTEKI